MVRNQKAKRTDDQAWRKIWYKIYRVKKPKTLKLVLVRCSNLWLDIFKNIDKMAAPVELLFAMGITLDESQSIGTIGASIDVTKLKSIATAIKTISESELS